MKLRTEHLCVGMIGPVNIKVPIVAIGDGTPRVALTVGVHGNEHAGFFIVRKLIGLLESSRFMRGTLYLVLSANPYAVATNSRVTIADYGDLNRVGQGYAGGYFTQRLGSALFQFLSNFDFVISLHEFEMITPLTAALIKTGNQEVLLKTISAIHAFQPDFIWLIDPSEKEDSHYESTIDASLMRAGVPNFPIETSSLCILSDEDIQAVSFRLLKVLELIINGEKTSTKNKELNIYKRKEFTSDYSGLWEPRCFPITTVAVGTLLGTLYKFPSLEAVSITAPISGDILQVRTRSIVSTGTSLFSIGIKQDYMEVQAK